MRTWCGWQLSCNALPMGVVACMAVWEGLLLHLNYMKELCPDHTKLSHPLSFVKLPGITFGNRCWLIVFNTIVIGDADGWCQNWSVWSTPQFILKLTMRTWCGWQLSCNACPNFTNGCHRLHGCLRGLLLRLNLCEESCPDHTKLSCPLPFVKLLGIMFGNDVSPSFLTQLQSEIPTDGVRTS